MIKITRSEHNETRRKAGLKPVTDRYWEQMKGLTEMKAVWGRVFVDDKPLTEDEIMDDLITVEPVVIEKKKGFGLTLTLKRVGTGLEVFCQSQAVEDYFKDGGRVSRTITEGCCRGLSLYSFRTGESFTDTDNGSVDEPSYSLIINSDGKSNCSFLRAVGLGNGIKFVVPMVCSEERLEKFRKCFERYIVEFYRAHMKPYAFKLEISTSEVNG